MFKMRPAFAAVVVLLVTSGSFWLPLAMSALRKMEESTVRRQQEGFELISKMVRDGSVEYTMTDRIHMRMIITVEEVWRTDDRDHVPGVDQTPQNIANLAHDWVCQMGFKVPMTEGESEFVEVEPIMVRAALDFKRVIWNTGITQIGPEECAKVDRGMSDIFDIVTQKKGDHIWSTGHCVDATSSVGLLLNNCYQEVCNRAGECVRVGRLRGDLKISNEYQLVLTFLLKPVR